MKTDGVLSASSPVKQLQFLDMMEDLEGQLVKGRSYDFQLAYCSLIGDSVEDEVAIWGEDACRNR